MKAEKPTKHTLGIGIAEHRHDWEDELQRNAPHRPGWKDRPIPIGIELAMPHRVSEELFPKASISSENFDLEYPVWVTMPRELVVRIEAVLVLLLFRVMPEA